MVEQGKGGVNVSIQTNLAAVDLLRETIARGEMIEGMREVLVEKTSAEPIAIAAGPAGPAPC